MRTSKDPISKKKFWSYNVIFKRLDGSVFENMYRFIADGAIIMLPHITNVILSFTLAPFSNSFEDVFGETQLSIQAIISKLNLRDTHPEEVHNWSGFWESVPHELHNEPDDKPSNFHNHKVLFLNAEKNITWSGVLMMGAGMWSQ